ARDADPDGNAPLLIGPGADRRDQRPGDCADQGRGRRRGGNRLSHGNIRILELGLNASWTAGAGIGFPGVQVGYQSPVTFTEEEWEHHWKMAAWQVKDTVEGKGQRSRPCSTTSGGARVV